MANSDKGDLLHSKNYRISCDGGAGNLEGVETIHNNGKD